ncbi:MAG: peptidoglycan DD-metalloendopeptidase family protein [Flavobacteriales bacterium]
MNKQLRIWTLVASNMMMAFLAVAQEPNTGGATREEMLELNINNPTEDQWFTLSDSIARIPAYDVYCHWDTQNLFRHKGSIDDFFHGYRVVLQLDSCDFVYPTPGVLTSPFGPRWGRMHYGLDIDLETGDAVSAAFEGMVRISQHHDSYGNVVVIRHNNGLETLYAHLSERSVYPGDHVEAGDIIGLGGNTGRSYGSHLHFEIRFLGEAIDPSYVVDPHKRKLKMSEFVLDKGHFKHVNVDKTALDARKDSQVQNKTETKTSNPEKKKVATDNKGKSNSTKNKKSNSTVAKKFHSVKSGETLSHIAVKYNTTVTNLCKLNGLSKNSTLQIGQKIRYK